MRVCVWEGATCWWRRRHGHGPHVLPESVQLLLLLLGLGVGQLLAEPLVLGPVVSEEGGRAVRHHTARPRPQHRPRLPLPTSPLVDRGLTARTRPRRPPPGRRVRPIRCRSPQTRPPPAGGREQPIRSLAARSYFLPQTWQGERAPYTARVRGELARTPTHTICTNTLTHLREHQ